MLAVERFDSIALWISSAPVALLLSFERALSSSDGVNAEFRSFGERLRIWELMMGSSVALSCG